MPEFSVPATLRVKARSAAEAEKLAQFALANIEDVQGYLSAEVGTASPLQTRTNANLPISWARIYETNEKRDRAISALRDLSLGLEEAATSELENYREGFKLTLRTKDQDTMKLALRALAVLGIIESVEAELLFVKGPKAKPKNQ